MTKNKAILCGAIISLGTAAIIGLIHIEKNSPKRFYRLETKALYQDGEYFEVDKKQRQIYFKKDANKELLEEIPSLTGSLFCPKEKKMVKISPKLSGKIGFYTYLYLEGRPMSQKMEFILEINRKGRTREIRKIKAPKISCPLFQDLEVRRGDRIVMKFSGHGIVYFSQPILYEKYAADQAAKRTNVILIAADTFRGDQLGEAEPGKVVLTPNLNRFANDAVYLKNTYAQTSWTLPSFMSLFTALNEYNHGVGIKSPLDPKLPSLVEKLSSKFVTFGYHGGMVMKGKWGFSRGFDFYKEFLQTTPLYPQGGRSLFEKAVELLQNSQFPRLFLFLHTYQLHSPYTPPEEFLHRLNPRPRFTKLDAVNFNQPAKTYLPVEAGLKASLKELYQAEILAFDQYFGDFISKLKEMDLYDRSLIIVMSDHGEEFFDHQGWAHAHSLYNELLKVPLLIKFPGGQFANTRLVNPVGIVDIMPTVLSFCDVAYDAGRLDGRNLMPLIRSGGKAKRGCVVSTISTGKYFDSFPTRIALVFDRYKLIYNEPYTPQSLKVFEEFAPPLRPPRFELFDLQSDPNESLNIISDRPGIKRKMLPHLLRIRKTIGQKLAGKNTNALDEKEKKLLEALGYL